jgi:hypothetical protein
MPKTWMKFACEDCGEENWLNEDFNMLKEKGALIYCSECGFVRGPVERIEHDDDDASTLHCISYDKTMKRIHTTGPLGTRWGTPDGGSLDRMEFMKRCGFDPWTDWNHQHQRTKRENRNKLVMGF